jgi:hypothetical protein
MVAPFNNMIWRFEKHFGSLGQTTTVLWRGYIGT